MIAAIHERMKRIAFGPVRRERKQRDPLGPVQLENVREGCRRRERQLDEARHKQAYRIDGTELILTPQEAWRWGLMRLAKEKAREVAPLIRDNLPRVVMPNIGDAR